MKKYNLLFKCLSISLLGLTSLALSSCNEVKLKEGNWVEEAYVGLSDFISDKGKESKSHQGNEYVVFDFDNTSCIFDMYEQFMAYQIKNMCFELTPTTISDVLATGIPSLDKDLTDFGYPGETYSDWINVLKDSYSYLYNEFGPFNYDGIKDQTKLDNMHGTDQYKEFSSRMSAMYELLGTSESYAVSYPWITYWNAGMSEEQLYNICYRSHCLYKEVQTSSETWTSPSGGVLKQVSYTFNNGITVTDEIKNLMSTLSKNDIKVWVCSASYIDAVRAAVDAFDLHPYITGVIGMTNSIVNNKITNIYDYQTGYAYLTTENGWVKGTLASRAQPQGLGKVTAIENILVPKYGHGPNAGFMDSTGDFNFCSEFKDTSIVICFNRGNRKVTDGGGLIAEVAMYQKEHLHYDYKTAKENDDIYYCLQGRDENNYRSFRKSNKTVLYNSSEETLFANSNNQTMFDYFKSHNLSTKDIINTYCLKSSNNSFGFKYGFLDSYNGYRSR